MNIFKRIISALLLLALTSPTLLICACAPTEKGVSTSGTAKTTAAVTTDNAENKNGDATAESEEYEMKKKAYREKLKNTEVTDNSLLIGSWVTFYSFDIQSYEYQLDRMAEAGLNFSLFPYNFGSPIAYEDGLWDYVEEQYAKRNMLYHVNSSTDKNYLETAVKNAAGKAHCIGYHLIDEPWDSQLEEVAALTRAYREADPERYPFTNLFPSYVNEGARGGSYRHYVEHYVESVGAENIDYLSHDYYPFRGDSEVAYTIFSDMEIIRSVAYANGKLKTHAFPQSTAWNGMRMPNINEMRWNVYAYLAYGFKALSWFNLVCPGGSDTEGEGFRNCLIYRDGNIRNPKLYAKWSELNWEIRGLSDALMNLDTVHAYHTTTKVSGVEYLPDRFFITPSKNPDMIISCMVAKDGSDPYIMIFNNSTTRKSKNTEFVIDSSCGVEAIEYLDPLTGEYVSMNITDGKFTDSFNVGEGKLYRLKGNFDINELFNIVSE